MMEQSLGYAIYQRQNFPESCEYVHIAQIENKQENIAYLFLHLFLLFSSTRQVVIYL